MTKVKKILKSTNTYILLLFVTYIVFYLQDHVTAVLAGFDLAETGDSTFGKIITISLFLLCWYKIFNSRIKIPTGITHLLAAWIVVTTFSNMLCLTKLGQVVNVTFQQMLWPTIFVYFCCEARNIPKNIFYTVISILFLLCSYFVYQETIFMRGFARYLENLQVNEIYFVVLLFPWVFSFDGKFFGKIKYLLLVIGLYLVFFSFKRTAMLCVALGAFFYILCLLKQGRMKGTHFALVLTLMIGGYILFDLVNEQSGNRIVERIELTKTDKGSGRLDIYGKVLNATNSFSIGDYLFGKGRGSIGKYTGGYSAHNEYLEVFFSWGIIALVIYILLLVNIFRSYRFIRKEDIPIFVMSIGVFLSMSITSHLVIYPYLFNIIVSFWGYTLSKK